MNVKHGQSVQTTDNKRNLRKGFSIVQIILVILGIAILTAATIFASISFINSSKYSKTQQELTTLQTPIMQFMLENPQYARSVKDGNDADLAAMLTALNVYLDGDMKISLANTGTEEIFAVGGGSLTSISGIKTTDYIGIARKDAWGTPYRIYVNPSQLVTLIKNGGTAPTYANLGKPQTASTTGEQNDSELRIFIVSSGPNGKTGGMPTSSAALIDEDDVFVVCEYINGTLRTGFHGLRSDDTPMSWGTAYSLNQVTLTPPDTQTDDLG